MKKFKLALAQVPSFKGKVDANIEIHLNAVKVAAKKEVSLIVFPELSITGYEPQLAKELALLPDEVDLKPFAKAAQDNEMYIAIGAPLKSKYLPKIGLVIFTPKGEILSYSKMNLHESESEYFESGESHLLINMQEHCVAFAICADTNNPLHIKSCYEKGATIYLASVLLTDSSYDSDEKQLKNYARDYNMLVGISNHNKPTGNWQAIGQSAIWNEKGLIAKANKKNSCLVIAEKQKDDWIGKVITL